MHCSCDAPCISPVAVLSVCRCCRRPLPPTVQCMLRPTQHNPLQWQLPSSPIIHWLIPHTVCWWHAQTLIIFITISRGPWLHPEQRFWGDWRAEMLRSGGIIFAIRLWSDISIWKNKKRSKILLNSRLKHFLFLHVGVQLLPLRLLSHLLFTNFTIPFLWKLHSYQSSHVQRQHASAHTYIHTQTHKTWELYLALTQLPQIKESKW